MSTLPAVHPPCPKCGGHCRPCYKKGPAQEAICRRRVKVKANVEPIVQPGLEPVVEPVGKHIQPVEPAGSEKVFNVDIFFQMLMVLLVVCAFPTGSTTGSTLALLVLLPAVRKLKSL